MLRPVSAHSLYACCALSLILEKPRVPGGGWGWGAGLGRAHCLWHPLELSFLGELFCIIHLKHYAKEPSKIRLWCTYAKEEAGLSWGEGTSSPGSLSKWSKQDPKTCHTQCLGWLGESWGKSLILGG